MYTDKRNPTHPFTGNAAATSRKRRDWVELCIGYGLILLVIWTPRPLQTVLYYTTIVVLFIIFWTSFEGWAAMGLGAANFLRSLWIVGVALLLVAIAVLIAVRLHTLRAPDGALPFLKRYGGYAVWSLVQQILLLDFFLLRFLRLLPTKKSAVIATAGVFALAHLPNPILSAPTLLWGIVACLLFLRYRNLYPLAMAHAIFGICIAITVPGPVSHNMRVGLGYLQYRPRHPHQRSHSDHMVSTHAWVMADAPTRRC
ncbi:MAG: CPBP family intramembrane glutamic endopeptidase [Acidobacteriaceae bacterium]